MGRGRCPEHAYAGVARGRENAICPFPSSRYFTGGAHETHTYIHSNYLHPKKEKGTWNIMYHSRTLY